MPHDEEWQILAEEAAQEKDPNKLIEIVDSLTAALDERLTTKAAGQQTISFKSRTAERQIDSESRRSKSRPA